ncbi:histone-lysine N-methyltransferase, H3 lysine-79 specific-like [Ostrea edulis]|uniref:histone-lysine N-methyltransferase, H3 lysine-79 specific-like n=1 Tax=Ostrea edulis TaxID=37623 RepID=UPI0024AFBC2A|nr:histone-lysine N-methyltransferase, H3 lysine-79 specific-like [Ostrea edulis]
MAVATGRKTSAKLISVNSNEGLVSEKRTTKDVQRAAINNVNQTSDSNNKLLPSSPTETVVIPIGPASDKIRPCSGSSILKRNARPSSGHSVKFVETETIIAIQNASTSFPISENTSSNSDFNTSLGTINQQKLLKVLSNASNKSCHQTGIPPLSKNSRTSSKTQTSHEGIENDSIPTKTDMAMEHELNNGMSSRTQYNVDENNCEENFKSSTHNHESLGARKLGSTGDKAVVNTGNDSANQQREQKEDKKMAMNSKPESNDISLNSLNEKGELTGEEIQIDKGNVEGSEEYIEDMPNTSNENMPNISSHQPSFGRTGERKTHTQRQVSFHRKKVIYNTDLCPTDGDMIREGYYQTKGCEIERRHIRHRDLKEIMAEQTVSENEEVQFQDTTNLKGYENRDIENRIPDIRTDSNEIPSQAKKRLHELYKELKRVREEIALMYSLEEADKERMECDKNSKNDDNGHEHKGSGDSEEEMNDSKSVEVERENQVVERISDKDSENTEVEKEKEVIDKISVKGTEKTEVKKETEINNRISIKDPEKTEVEKRKEGTEKISVKDTEKTEVEKRKEGTEKISVKDPEKTEVEKEKKVTAKISVKDKKETEVENENEVINKVSVKDPKKTKVEKEKEVILRISVDDSEKIEVEEEKGVIEKISVKDSEKTKVETQTEEVERISVNDLERTEMEKEKPSNEMMSVKDSDKTEVNKEKEVVGRISVTESEKREVEEEPEVVEGISFKDSEKKEMKKENKVVERISVITTATPTIRKETNDLNNADETADNLDKQNTTEKQKEDRTYLISKICSERNKESEDLAMTTDIHIKKEIKEIDIQENIEISERADEMEKVIQNKDNTESSEKSNASDEEKENVFIERVSISNSDSVISKNVNDKNDCITTTDTEGCSQSNTNSLSFIVNDANSDLSNKNENLNVEKFEQSELNEGAVQITGASASSKVLYQDDSVKESKEQDIPFALEEDQDLDCEIPL